MAYVNLTSRGSSLASTVGAAATAVGAAVLVMLDAWQRARVFRDTHAELDSLSARKLDDLGISRTMITRVAYEAAYGPKA